MHDDGTITYDEDDDVEVKYGTMSSLPRQVVFSPLPISELMFTIVEKHGEVFLRVRVRGERTHGQWYSVDIPLVKEDGAS